MSSLWTIEGDLARLQLGSLSAQWTLCFPQRGLQEVQLGGFPAADSPATFLAVQTQPASAAEHVQDCYVRGSDLVVTYAETPSRNIRLQLYWRACEFPAANPQAFGVDLIVSTQTSLLYSDPTLWVESRMPAEGEPCAVAAAGEAGPILFRLNSPAWSFAQAVHPADVEESLATLDDCGRGAIRQRLFAPGLEKGVIRRARLRGLFVPRQRDAQLAAASYASFLTQELPLTT